MVSEVQATAKSSILKEIPFVENRLRFPMDVSFELHSHSLASALARLRVWEITVARTTTLDTLYFRPSLEDCVEFKYLTVAFSCSCPFSLLRYHSEHRTGLSRA